MNIDNDFSFSQFFIKSLPKKVGFYFYMEMAFQTSNGILSPYSSTFTIKKDFVFVMQGGEFRRVIL